MEQRDVIFNFIRAMSLVRKAYVDPKKLPVNKMLSNPLESSPLRSAFKLSKSDLASYVQSKRATPLASGSTFPLTIRDKTSGKYIQGKSLEGELSAYPVGTMKFALPNNIKRFIEDPGQSIISGDPSTKIRGWRIEIAGRSGLRTQTKKFSSGRLGIQDYRNSKLDFARGVFVTAKFGASGVRTWVLYE